MKRNKLDMEMRKYCWANEQTLVLLGIYTQSNILDVEEVKIQIDAFVEKCIRT